MTIDNVAPTIAVSGAATVDEGSMYSLTLGAVTDPGNDTPSVFIVDWGDGSDPSAFTTTGVKTHVFESDGAMNITVSIADDDGLHASAGTHNVTVNNVAPVAINGSSETLAAINEDTADNDIPGATVNTLFPQPLQRRGRRLCRRRRRCQRCQQRHTGRLAVSRPTAARTGRTSPAASTRRQQPSSNRPTSCASTRWATSTAHPATSLSASGTVAAGFPPAQGTTSAAASAAQARSATARP